MLPQKRATKDAVRSAKLGSATASCSSSFTVRTLRRVISLTRGLLALSCDMDAKSWPCRAPRLTDAHGSRCQPRLRPAPTAALTA